MEQEKFELYNEHAIKLISYYLNNMEKSITDEEVKQVCSCGVSEEFAVNLLLANHLDIDNEEFSRMYFSNMVELVDREEIENNAYYKNINFPTVVDGEWEFKMGEYAPFEIFVKNDFKIEGKKITPDLGYFNEKFTFPAVYQNDRMWMSVSPNEINTMQYNIAYARGKVLTFGLGLGYFAYMCSLKSEVTSITIVEKNEKVIELVNKYILPQFEFKDKITIIKADAYDYIKTLKDGEFDYAFVDIYHDAGDGVEVYLNFHDTVKEYKRTKIEFWIEKSIRFYV
jgi:hypothetical protein